MKKLFIFIALIVFFSCKKEPCYICETETYSKPNEILIDVKTETVCNMDEIEILSYQIEQIVFKDSYYTKCECKLK
jgi:hypothetical protein